MVERGGVVLLALSDEYMLSLRDSKGAKGGTVENDSHMLK